MTVPETMPESKRKSASRLPPFERVVEEHGRLVLRFCGSRVGPERAEDCFQETMLAALAAYETVREPAAIRSWLIAIAARKAADLHRAGARAPLPLADPEPALGGDGASEPIELGDVELWQRIGELPAKQREAVTLRFAAGLSHRQVGQQMGTTEAAARRNVFEALRRLRKEVTR